MIGIYNDIKIYDANGGAETTYTGEAQVGVSATQYASVKNLKVGFEASQALNGYDFPWAEGSSVNKLPNAENFKGWVIGDSGAVAHVYKNYTGTVNFKSVLANIEPQQSGSGDPSPSNVRPITGFDSANINVSGNQLINTSTNESGAIDASGNEVANSSFNRTQLISISKGTIFFRSDIASGYTVGIHGYNNGSWVQQLKVISTSVGYETSITIPSTVNQVRISYPTIGINNTYLYEGNTYSVSFGSAGTVYGGTLDVVSGQLTVERAFITLDETANWSWSTATLRPHVLISGMEIKGAVISNMYPYSSSSVAVDGTITTNAGSGNDVWIYDTVNAPDLNSWKTFVASNNLQVVYTLATPLTYQLTATQVAMITGNNYVWSDTGDMEDVSFYAQSGASYYAYLSAGNYLLSPKFRTRWLDGYTSKALSGQYSNTGATDVDLYICGTDAGLDSESWNLTKHVKWGTISLPYKSSMTSMPTQVIQTKTSNMTEGSGTITNVYFKFVNTSEGQVRLYRLQLQWGSTASDFRPYTNKGAITGISTLYLYKRSTPSGSQQTYYSKYLNGTRYKGVYDFRTGTLTLTHALVTLNSTNQTWYSTYTTSGSTNYYRYYCVISDMKVTGATSADFKCTDFRYTSSPNSYTTDWGYYGPYYSGSARLYFGNYPNYFATLDDFKAWLDAQETAGTPVRVMYPLTSPETVSLTGTTITLNNGMTYFDGGTSNRFVSVEAVITDPYVMLKRPSDFVIEREDIYAGEYTTCLGATKADRIGWKYKDTNIVFSELTVDELAHLTAINGEFSLIFDDSDGEHTESVIRTGFSNTPTRFTLPDGNVIWKDVGLAIRFINAHS